MIPEQWDKLDRRKKTCVIALVAVAAVLLADRLVVRYVAGRIADMRAGIEAEQSERLDNSLALSDWRAGSGESAFQSVRETIGVAEASSGDIAIIKDEIDELARLNGVSIDSLEHREPAFGDGYVEYIIIIGHRSSMEKLVSLIQEIHSMPGMSRVVRLNIAPDKDGGVVRGNMTVSRLMLAGSSREG